LYDVDMLYEGGTWGLVALASPSSPEAAVDLDRTLWDIIGTFRKDLHFENRPTTPEVRAALSKSRLADDVEWLRTLDPDTRRLLAREAHYERPDPQREPDFIDGELRLRTLERVLDDGARWVQLAKWRLEGKPGRPLLQSVHDAVHCLREAWRAANGSDPTLSSPEKGRATSPFLTLVRAALNPALRAHGMEEMNFERAVRDELYKH
jgi:hypothetical protein